MTILSFSQEEDELYLNYVFAAKNNSTFQLNLVIKFKNLNTNSLREICVEGEQLMFAYWHENNLDFGATESFEKYYEMLNENKSRYFEFKNSEAIETIENDSYSEAEYIKFEKKIDFEELAKKIRQERKWEGSFDRKILKIYAHALFNRGILTGQNDCFGGETLQYVDRNNFN